MSKIDELKKSHTREKIIKYFLKVGEIVNFREIKELLKNDSNRPDFHLKFLVESGYIERTEGRGSYRLKKSMYNAQEKNISKKKDLFSLLVA